MKNNFFLFLLSCFFILLATNATADRLTCPVRPAYIDCPARTPVPIVDPLADWQPNVDMVGYACPPDGGRVYFKFLLVDFDKTQQTMKCWYTAQGDRGPAKLILTSSTYVPDDKDPYSYWSWDTDGEDCGHTGGTNIDNCPIKLK